MDCNDNGQSVLIVSIGLSRLTVLTVQLKHFLGVTEQSRVRLLAGLDFADHQQLGQPALALLEGGSEAKASVGDSIECESDLDGLTLLSLGTTT